MKSTLLAVVLTAIIVAPLTFVVTKNIDKRKVTVIEAQPYLANPYPVDSAISHINNFHALADTILNSLKIPNKNMVVAYTISGDDLVTALGATIVDDKIKWSHPFARVYLGFSNDSGFRMFMVSVDTAGINNGTCGNDRFFDIDSVSKQGSPECWVHVVDTHGAGNCVLDLISPCPMICDTSSKLMRTLPGDKVQCSCNTPANTTRKRK